MRYGQVDTPQNPQRIFPAKYVAKNKSHPRRANKINMEKENEATRNS